MQSRVFVFDIENQKEEYAKCLMFIKKGLTDEIAKWVEQHVGVICFSQYSKLRNNYRSIIYSIEKSIQTDNLKPLEQGAHTSNRTDNNDFYYFRVKNNNDDDVVNLHYYYLLRSKTKNCFMGLVPRDNQDIFRISHFLAYETLRFSMRKNAYLQVYKIGKGSENRHKPYGLQLKHHQDEEHIFRLEKNKSGSFSPKIFNHADLDVSRDFFPLIPIDRDCFDVLARCVQDVFKTPAWIKPEDDFRFIRDDLLLEAFKPILRNISLDNESTLAEYSFKGKSIELDNSIGMKKIIVCSLQRYCRKL